MFILGVDTATSVAGAAVIEEDRLISERFVNNLKTHSENIIPMIKQVMDDAGIKPDHLHAIAVTGGPGSFTGLRIGMSVAKTMGQVLNIPVIAISTLRMLAWNVYGVNGIICPVLDARRNQVYTAVYRSAPGDFEELLNPAALEIDRLVSGLMQFDEGVTFVGDGIPVFGPFLKERLGEKAHFGTLINSRPRAAAAAELGLAKLKAGRLPDPMFLQPVYLRKSEAELTWEKKHGS
ncbi:MAG: tRNA (adenosine(37)-N6)-threonylcarbamoyltransferase complex dimerization subunit type 1 TsaB [Firmicutes bacterium HGW-Firmicutes-14]|nr:MAG: tRNA (adenosine(37)-N6)-threonylcarbamoyltransferase complex dimerization subunit type 1 TsaB [Firmicutes bacterium HGW-Firmicutes-14]